jgi:hypothetical protein
MWLAFKMCQYPNFEACFFLFLANATGAIIVIMYQYVLVYVLVCVSSLPNCLLLRSLPHRLDGLKTFEDSVFLKAIQKGAASLRMGMSGE